MYHVNVMIVCKSIGIVVREFDFEVSQLSDAQEILEHWDGRENSETRYIAVIRKQ